jgi:putative SOS response-associated peptidase YedK
MCVNFTPATPTSMQRLTGLEAPAYRPEAFPGYAAPMIRAVDVDAAQVALRVDTALFGLVPRWAKDRSFGKRTYNARSETVAAKPSYRMAWRQRKFCLVPMEQCFEPCWETGRAVRWRIHRRDQAPFAVAGIWENWTDPSSGELVTSFSLLTINADGHAVMGRFHRPGDERRSLVVVPASRWTTWLCATTAAAGGMLEAMEPGDFAAEPASAEPVQRALL